MTEKEMLDRAAQAAGIKRRNVRWNPLENDGDALRLAIKVGLTVTPYYFFDERRQKPAIARRPGGMLNDVVGAFPTYEESSLEHDPCAATRLAIVRAAALCAP